MHHQHFGFLSALLLAILLVACQAKSTSITNLPIRTPATAQPSLSPQAKANTTLSRFESPASTHTPYLQKASTATGRPTPTLPNPDVRLLGQIGGVYALWQDSILGVTFEIPISWGKIEAEWGTAETGHAYNYLFDIDPGMLQAGGRSADYSIQRGGTWTDFGGFGGENTTEICAVSHYFPSACTQVQPDTAFLIALPTAQMSCEDRGPGSFGEPFVEVMINLPDNPYINGFVFVSKFLSPELQDEVSAARHYFLQDSDGFGAEKCDPESQAAYDQWMEDFVRRIENGDVDEGTALNLSRVEHLARSIKIK